MAKTRTHLALAGVFAAIATPAAAQDEEALRQELADMRAMIAQMSERMEAIQAQLAETEAEAEAATAQAKAAQEAARTAAVEAAQNAEALAQVDTGTSIKFKGTPQISTDDGWSFKPRGRLQFDAGFFSVPDSTGVDDGFGSETRRARLGASGDLPGGFGYKVEIDFAAGDLTVTDAIISYETGDVEFLVGQFNTFQGLEELSSSLHTSFIERSAFTDAFDFERRVGAAIVVESGDLLVQTGVFTDNMEDLPDNNNWSVDGRVVFNPKLGDTQLHLGGSLHYNELESGSTVRYRQRPLVHFTSERLINTGQIAATSEFGVGVEGAFIAGPLHAAAEGFWQNVDTPMGLGDPTFFGGSIEVGYFFTEGDTRGYKGGKFDRVKPNKPVGEGGFGSLQANVRYDRLDLNDAGFIGGTQDGFMASLIWKPTDYTLLLINYARLEYSDAVFPTATGDQDYGADVLGVRAQIDF